MTIEGCRAVKEISFYNTLIFSEKKLWLSKISIHGIKTKYIC